MGARNYLVTACLLMLNLACSDSSSPDARTATTKIMDHADAIDVLRLELQSELIGVPEKPSAPGFLEGYAVKATVDAKSLGPAFAKQLQTAINNAVPFDGRHTNCGLHPGIAVRFTKAKQTASFLFCYHCGDALVVV